MKIQSSKLHSIQHACAVTDTCFSYLLDHVRPGVTEKEIAGLIEKYLHKNGALLAFPSIVAFGTHTSVVHYKKAKQSTAMLDDTDIVLLDFGAKVDGYCADMTRVVFVGKPKAEWIRAYETVRNVQRAIIDTLDSQVKKLFSGATLDKTAKDMIQKAGFPPYKHSLGHAIGLEVHEAPRLSVKKDAQIIPGMVFTIEPGTYIENEYGIRIEDTVLLKEDGLEMLTKSPKELIVLNNQLRKASPCEAK